MMCKVGKTSCAHAYFLDEWEGFSVQEDRIAEEELKDHMLTLFRCLCGVHRCLDSHVNT